MMPFLDQLSPNARLPIFQFIYNIPKPFWEPIATTPHSKV